VIVARPNFRRLTCCASLVALALGGFRLALPGGPQGVMAASGTSVAGIPAAIAFNRDIRPLLADRCFACHGPDGNKRISGLRLDRPVQAFGPLPKHPQARALVPGHPEQSVAWQRITSTDPAEMMPPPAYHHLLSAADKTLIKTWIEQGARWEEHWAFVPPVRPEPPAVTAAPWARNAIDRFILARLEQEGFSPAPEADKATLIRRVTLDLTGIPPTLAEVDAFLADAAPTAYEKLVERLLASPRYGEQMAATWLDYARYADSHGYQSDPERHMWRWRDWVINAFNANMPFDQFTIEQLAGDLLPAATQDQKIATGFNRNGRINGEGGIIAEEWRVETVIDRVETTSAVFLGLTMGCCRCHDHKYDPITQKEFYRFGAYFNSINETGVGDTGTLDRGTNAPPVIRVYSPEQTQRIAELNTQIAACVARLAQPNADKAKITAEQTAATKERDGIANDERNTTMVMEELPKPRDTFVLLRGQYDKHGDKVEPGLPEVLAPAGKVSTPRNRLELAQWIVNPANPLTARVQANRLWEKFFGVGLVKTTENFGTQADWPSHPELLDWLGTELVRLKWDLKAFQKLIVTSATYRQAGTIRPELLERDPENRLLARAPRLRLSAETVRDQALAISGLLVEKIGGPSVKPYAPAQLWADNRFGNLAKYVEDKGDSLYRRSLYTFWKRTATPPNLTMFDMPSREYCIIKRSRTNTPLQALTLLNDPTFLEAARVLGQHMITDGGTTPEQRVAWGFRRATGRLPAAAECKILTDGIEPLRTHYQQDGKAAADLLSLGATPRPPQLEAAELAAYTMTASVILNLDEMVNKP